MSLLSLSGLLAVWLLATLFVATLSWREFRRVRFNFNLFFSLVFLLTFFLGFPFTSLLVLRFNISVAPPGALLQALLSAVGFYAIYYCAYKIRLAPLTRGAPSRVLFNLNRAETHLIWILLLLVALISVAIFFLYNGFLLFKLTSYSQIFSRVVAGVALKRFFYFFIPAMLVLFFLRPNRRGWWFFLLSTLGFGVLTYLIIGGTRANIMIALALFLLLGLQRNWISLSWLFVAGAAGIVVMFWLALKRYGLDVQGEEAFYTFLYLTRDTFSPWENLALLLQHYDEIVFQGLAPIVRDFYVFIPSWLWPERPALVLNTANYLTWEVLNNHSGLAMSPTVIGSLLVMGGWWLVPAGALVTGLIIRGFDWLYRQGSEHGNRYQAAIIHSFCFGAVFNIIVLVREGLDAFFSRLTFFVLVFVGCVLLAKLLYRLRKNREQDGR